MHKQAYGLSLKRLPHYKYRNGCIATIRAFGSLTTECMLEKTSAEREKMSTVRGLALV